MSKEIEKILRKLISSQVIFSYLHSLEMNKKKSVCQLMFFLGYFDLIGFLNLHLLALNQYDLTKILCSVFGGGIRKNIRKNLLNYLMNLIAIDI